jgi:hypothetical protein
MTTPAGRRGSFLIVATLLVLSILLEQYWIARLFPWVSNLGGVQPMIVFLDIPLRLPVIDWIPVSILFVFFYLIVMAPELRRDGYSLWKKGWAVIAGWWVLLVCLTAGGVLFYVLQGFLPRAVRNGIDSFGIRADIALPYPSDSTVHLNGGMILLVCLLIGGRYFLRATAYQPAVAHAAELVPARGEKARVRGKKVQAPRTPGTVRTAAVEEKKVQRVAREVAREERAVVREEPKALVQAVRHEEQQVRVVVREEPKAAARTRAVPVTVIPESAIKGSMSPCVVTGEIKPAVFRMKDSRQSTGQLV